MNKEALTAVKDRLARLVADGTLAYAGEDVGQLDAAEPSVAMPCALIGAGECAYTDRRGNVQDAAASITVRYACRAETGNGFEAIDHVQRIYSAVQGLSGDNFSALTRSAVEKTVLGSGIQHYLITFRFAFVDAVAAGSKRYAKADPVFVEMPERE